MKTKMILEQAKRTSIRSAHKHNFFIIAIFANLLLPIVSLVTEVTYVYGDVDFSESPTQPHENPLMVWLDYETKDNLSTICRQIVYNLS